MRSGETWNRFIQINAVNDLEIRGSGSERERNGFYYDHFSFTLRNFHLLASTPPTGSIMFSFALASAGFILSVPFLACKYREFTEGVAFFAHSS
jgi:hypothetical protein